MLCPRRGEVRIQVQGALIQIARADQPVVGPCQLVRTQVEFVRARVRPGIRGRRRWRAGQRKRQGVHHPPGDVVLNLEEIPERGLNGVRGQQCAARRLDELRRGTQLIAGADQRSHDHAVHVGFRRERLQIRRLAGKPRGDGTGSKDERSVTRQGCRDCVGQAERQEIRLGIGTQHAERQHDQTGERAGQGRRRVAIHRVRGTKLRRHFVGRCRALDRALRQGATDHAVERGNRRRSRESRGLFVSRGVHDFDDRPARERRPACQHLEQDCTGREEIAPAIDHLAGHLLGRHVARRPHHHSRHRQLAVRIERHLEFRPGQTEVEQLDPVRRHEHI